MKYGGLKCLLWLVTWWIKQKSPSFGWQLWWFVSFWVDASQSNNVLKIWGFGGFFVTLYFSFRKVKKQRNWGKNAWPSMNQRSPKVCLWITLTFARIWTGGLEIVFLIDKPHQDEAEVVCFTWIVCELSLSIANHWTLAYFLSCLLYLCLSYQRSYAFSLQKENPRFFFSKTDAK